MQLHGTCPKKQSVCGLHSCFSLGLQGIESWVTQLPNVFQDEFKNSSLQPWITIESGKQAGEVRYAGGVGTTAGNLTFVKIYDAG